VTHCCVCGSAARHSGGRGFSADLRHKRRGFRHRSPSHPRLRQRLWAALTIPPCADKQCGQPGFRNTLYLRGSAPMTLIINNHDVEQVLTMEATIAALEKSYKDLAIGEPVRRPRLTVPITT